MSAGATGKSEYPMHEKLAALSGANQAVGRFLEWLGEQGMFVAEWSNDDDHPFPVRVGQSLPELLAAYFGIDREALEQEKLAMLERLRRRNGAEEEGTDDEA